MTRSTAHDHITDARRSLGLARAAIDDALAALDLAAGGSTEPIRPVDLAVARAQLARRVPVDRDAGMPERDPAAPIPYELADDPDDWGSSEQVDAP